MVERQCGNTPRTLNKSISNPQILNWLREAASHKSILFPTDSSVLPCHGTPTQKLMPPPIYLQAHPGVNARTCSESQRYTTSIMYEMTCRLIPLLLCLLSKGSPLRICIHCIHGFLGGVLSTHYFAKAKQGQTVDCFILR